MRSKYKWFQEKIKKVENINSSSKLKKRKTLHLKQLEQRGWCDIETWSLDVTLGEFLAERLKRFAELTNGYPSSSSDDEWKTILKEMIEGFEILADDGRSIMPNKSDAKKIQKSFKLLEKWHFNLWW